LSHSISPGFCFLTISILLRGKCWHTVNSVSFSWAC
jgi:hypothetical protein